MPGVLLVGNGAREHAIAEAIMRSSHDPKLFSYMKTNNPGIASLSAKSLVGPYEELLRVLSRERDASETGGPENRFAEPD